MNIKVFYLCMQDKIEEYRVFLITIKDKGLDWNYQQKDFSSAEKFYEWITEAKKVSVIYDTDMKPRYSDEFVTIQTCLDAYSSKKSYITSDESKRLSYLRKLILYNRFNVDNGIMLVIVRCYMKIILDKSLEALGVEHVVIGIARNVDPNAELTPAFLQKQKE